MRGSTSSRLGSSYLICSCCTVLHNKLVSDNKSVRVGLNICSQTSLGRSVAHRWRGVGCRTLEKALASKGISKEFEEWIAIAKDRPKWRQQTHSKPKPPDGSWLMDNLGVYCWKLGAPYAQLVFWLYKNQLPAYIVTIALCKKDTQPSQTCSEGYSFFCYCDV